LVRERAADVIVDSSVLIAILQNEPEARTLAVALARATVCRLPASCHLESFMRILSRYGDNGVRDLDLLVAQYHMEIASFTESQARIARDGFRRYGNGRHPAQLNFGDCMAYALAKETGEELLFKGTDFGLTDVAVAAY
jgi:ribonuclease VapC